ncbi:DUF4260 domain-containing protein [Halobacillus litoralis]|uniref:DUF4260 domain-containing protein n=1 Tax=Halobacillus litoralis TaxID=45668 RepID=UPI001CFDB798|nr:DUF4260 domain-containing protein [Halobacillus litoralis]
MKVWLHMEGAVVLAASIYFYGQTTAPWWLFFLLLLSPDITMLGYAFNDKAGAFVYNVGHSYVLPVVTLIFSFYLNGDLILSLTLIWMAHIGMDRTAGYGLKSTKGFKETHLQKI